MLDNLYKPQTEEEVVNEENQDIDPELAQMLQEAYEAGIKDGYQAAFAEDETALDEGAIKDKWEKAKNWVKRNKYAIGSRALGVLGGINAGAGAAQLGVGMADNDSALKKAGLINGTTGAAMIYGSNKLMNKHKKYSRLYDIKHLNIK